MATEKDPSIFHDRGTVGNADELDEYGVWVKSEPQELGADDAVGGDFIEPALPDIEDLTDIDLDASFGESGSPASEAPEPQKADVSKELDESPEQSIIGDMDFEEISASDFGFGDEEPSSAKSNAVSAEAAINSGDEITELSMEDFLDGEEFSSQPIIEKPVSSDEEAPIAMDLDFHDGLAEELSLEAEPEEFVFEDIEQITPTEESSPPVAVEAVSEFDDFLNELSGSEAPKQAAATEATVYSARPEDAVPAASTSFTVDIETPIESVETDFSPVGETEDIVFDNSNDSSLDFSVGEDSVEAPTLVSVEDPIFNADDNLDLVDSIATLNLAADEDSANNENANLEEDIPQISEQEVSSSDSLSEESLDQVELSSPVNLDKPTQPNMTVEAPSNETSRMDLSTQLLMRIADELSSIKTEIASLKTELAAVRGSQLVNETDETVDEKKAENAKGFFDDEEDETIALTGDELDNILNTADFTEETGDSVVEASDFSSELENVQEEEFLSDRTDLIDGDIDLEESEKEVEFESETTVNEAFEGEPEELLRLREDGVQPMSEAPDNPEYLSDDDAIQEISLSEASEDKTLEDDLISVDTVLEEDAVNFSPTDSFDSSDIEIPMMDDSDTEPELTNDGIELELDGSTLSDELEQQETELESIEIEPIEQTISDEFAAAELENTEALANEVIQEEVVVDSKQTSSSEELSDLPNGLRGEIKSVLSYMDQLLESLPDEKIEEFARSDHFETYKKLFEELGLA